MRTVLGFSFTALLLCFQSPSSAAEPGSLFLDGRGGTAVWDSHHDWGRGGSLGLAFGADDQTELGLRLGYTFVPASSGSYSAVELNDGSVAAYFAPYSGDFQPMVGGHFGLVRSPDQSRLDWDLGMDAMALYDIRNRFQFYALATPSFLIRENRGEFWLRMGFGMRLRIGA